MQRGPKILAGALLAAYAGFLVWFGGHGKPLTAKETEQYLSRIQAKARNDAGSNSNIREELRTLMASDDGNEFFMLNLIRYRPKALYPAGYSYGDDPLEADARYSRAIIPYLLRHGGVPVFLAEPEGRFIDEAGDATWQRVAIVRYRSRRDLLEMIVDLAGQDVAVHKWASIEKTQVFPTRPLISLFSVRAPVGVLLALLGLILHFVLRRAAWYRGA